MKQETKRTDRNGELDFLKFEAAVLILLYHSTHLDAASGNSHLFLQGFTFYVEFFFILSGIFMAQHASISSSSARSVGILHASLSYLWSRFLRLAPEYYVGMLIAWVIDLFDRNVGLSYNLSLTVTSLDELFMIHSARDSYQTADPATWYISALMIGCAVLYPLLLSLGKWFTHYIAPLTAILIWGISYRVCGSILNMYMPVRAIMGLSFGISAWTVCQVLQSRISRVSSVLPLTALTRHLLSFLQILLNIGVLLMLAWKPEQLHWDAVLLFTMIAVIAWRGDSSLHPFFQHLFFTRLGSFSYCLYLANNAWSWEIPQMFPRQPYRILLLWYLLFSILTALAIRSAGKGLRRFWRLYKDALRGLFIRKK